MKDYRNKILQGHNINWLRKLPSEYFNMIFTSPPYYGLRSYGTEPVIWGGKEDCKHEWGKQIIRRNYGNVGKHPNVGNQVRDTMKGNENKGNFCIHCNAWKGELGLEPTYKLYIEHLIQVFDECYRVLRKDGTCWVNLGDSYASSGGASRHKGYTDPKYTNGRNGSFDEPTAYEQPNVQPKSQLCIPERFTIAMLEHKWIRRNRIIWHKNNCMPDSVKDRFTVDYEDLFFFAKSQKYFF